MKTDTMELGNINLSRRVLVSDPCYAPGTWCALTVNIKPGKWRATAEVYDEGHWGKRISSLRIEHEDYCHQELAEKLGGGAGVDSGQCGFWDCKKYNKACDTDGESFYDKACEITLADDNAGVFDDWGVVSASGYGDGGYPVYAARDKNGEVVALEIVYIDKEEDEEYDDEEEE